MPCQHLARVGVLTGEDNKSMLLAKHTIHELGFSKESDVCRLTNRSAPLWPLLVPKLKKILQETYNVTPIGYKWDIIGQIVLNFRVACTREDLRILNQVSFIPFTSVESSFMS